MIVCLNFVDDMTLLSHIVFIETELNNMELQNLMLDIKLIKEHIDNWKSYLDFKRPENWGHLDWYRQLNMICKHMETRTNKFTILDIPVIYRRL